MNAIRQVVKVQGRRVIIELPLDFTAEEVEVIVLAAEKTTTAESESTQSLTRLQQVLLEDKTVMSDEEYEFIMKKRRALNAWK